MEELKTAFELKFLPTIGEQAEVADALKSSGQDMKQKAANELAGVQRHQAGGSIGFAAAMEEGDFGIRNGLDAVIGNGHPMRITAKVFQHGFGGGEGPLGVDVPFVAAKGGMEKFPTLCR